MKYNITLWIKNIAVLYHIEFLFKFENKKAYLRHRM